MRRIDVTGRGVNGRSVARWVLAPLGVLGIVVGLAAPVSGADPVPGSQGTDTSLPLTDSALTVRGRGDYADLAITVNQTRNLTNQAVSITWEGGRPTTQGASRFSANYMQIMQCWGEDDGTVPGNPGPPPEQCVQGAVGGTYGGLPGTDYPVGFSLSRVISRTTWESFDEDVGYADERTGHVWMPFRAVDGTVVDVHTDPTFNPAVEGGNYWLNPYFDIVTTNEIAGGATRANGTGAELFQVLTGVESTGLGCGQRVLSVDGSAPTVPKCWLVVVPRGEPTAENAGTQFSSNADQVGVATSPVSPAAWANRIAIPLDFAPVDSPCRLGDDERRVSGNEMLLTAVASWQPVLCGEIGLAPFAYSSVGDPTARRQMSNPSIGAPGLVAVSKPVDAETVVDDSPIVYAPLAASGVTIGFNIERVPKPTSPEGAQAISGVRVAELNLTPRLVAKLLTQSYALAVSIGGPPPYEWVVGNPSHLGLDPDFLRFNPEFELLGNSDRNFAALTVPAGASDAAEQVWEWVLSDPEARAWLDGEPDEWGMSVNPVYSTNPEVNPSGAAFGEVLPNTIPRADPYCYQAPAVGARGDIVPPPLCGTDWLPSARNFEEAATMTRNAYDRARIVLNPFAFNETNAWSRTEPQYLGRRTFLSLTDTVSAARYGVQTARLSHAGDNGDDRTFVAADAAGITAGIDSMKARDDTGVRQPAVLDQGADAYPLTTLTYGAVAPLRLDDEARVDYADFVVYASTDGQAPGTALGELPPGYVPLPDALREEAIIAALVILLLEPAPEPEPESPATPSTPATSTTVPTPTTTSGSTSLTAEASPPVTRSNGSRSSSGVPAATESTTVDTVESTVPATTVEPEEDDEATTAPSATTPGQGTGVVRYAVPLFGGVAMLSALGALELTKRDRRALSGPPDVDPDEPGGSL